MPSQTKRVVGLTLGGLLFLSACTPKLIKSMAAVRALQQHLHEKYHDEVTVNLGGYGSLSIAFVNSPLNNEDWTKRFTRAQEAARFVALSYEDIRSIQNIWISFIAVEKRYVFVTYTRGLDSFSFDRYGAPLGKPESDVLRSNEPYTARDDPRAPVVRYSAITNQSDISVTRIQLEGNLKTGIALVPHFIAAGDARPPAKQVSPPEAVALDFASYSERPLFSETTNLEISCDNQVVAKGLVRLLPAKESGSDENVAQFISTHVSYKIFLRMANAKKVRLGPKRFELSAEDIRALAEMASYVGSEP